MRIIVCAATLVLLLWGTPALAGPCADSDGDTVCDVEDNCSANMNPAQDDTDGDDCGNICDGDFDNDGDTTVFELFDQAAFVGLAEPLYDMTEPVDIVGVFDLFEIVNFIGFPAGPSGTTAGTTECP